MSFDTERPMRLGVIGYGRMGKAHVEAALQTAEVELAGIADPILAGRDERWVIASSLDDLSSATQLDAVVIAAPTPGHEPLVRAALQRGLHVLCEKPLTLNPGRSAALGNAAAASGRILQVGYWRRFAEPFLGLRALIDSGRIGSVTAVRTAQWDASPPPAAFCDPNVSGGLEVDCGVHEFDLVRWLLGCEVEAVVSCAPQPSDELAAVEDVDTVYGLARLTGRRAMSIDLTRRAGHRDSIRVELIAERGSAVVEFAETGALVVRNGSALERSRLRSKDVIADALVAQLGAFAAAVAAGRPDPGACSAADCARALGAALTFKRSRDADVAWLRQAA